MSVHEVVSQLHAGAEMWDEGRPPLEAGLTGIQTIEAEVQEAAVKVDELLVLFASLKDRIGREVVQPCQTSLERLQTGGSLIVQALEGASGKHPDRARQIIESVTDRTAQTAENAQNNLQGEDSPVSNAIEYLTAAKQSVGSTLAWLTLGEGAVRPGIKYHGLASEAARAYASQLEFGQ